ncbi:unnamed protein product [Closterium sp. NIES-65]|nr:unnamed protein product [Closterium sp. NIES-65]
MTATLSTSPRAQSAAQRGEASRLQEQQREEQVGQGEVVALEALVDGAADAGAGETSSREDAAAVEPGMTPGVEAVVAAAADPIEVEQVERSPPAETAAASDDGLVSPVVARPAAMTPPADEILAAEEEQGESGLRVPPTPAVADSPPTLEETEIAAVVAEAVRQQGQPPSEAGAPTAAVFAGMPAATATTNTHEHGQAEGGIEGRAIAVASGAARRGGRRSCARSQHRGGLEQGWDLGPRDPSWAGFGKGRRHQSKRIERVAAPVTGGEDGSDNSQNGSESIPSHSEALEEVSLGNDENQNVLEQRRVRRGEQGGVPHPPNMPAGEAANAPARPSEKSPAELAKDESIWHLASTWDIAPLQQAD